VYYFLLVVVTYIGVSSWGKGWPARKAVTVLLPSMSRLSRKCGRLDVSFPAYYRDSFTHTEGKIPSEIFDISTYNKIANGQCTFPS
jgi:hypothetical protein